MKKHILICDDDEGIVDVMKLVLEEKNYEVSICTDGDSVLNTVRKSRPDLILLDLWMPGLRGEDLTQQLKKKRETKLIPIIIVSANKDTKAIARKIGADDFLAKPFDIYDLEKMVEKYL